MATQYDKNPELQSIDADSDIEIDKLPASSDLIELAGKSYQHLSEDVLTDANPARRALVDEEDEEALIEDRGDFFKNTNLIEDEAIDNGDGLP